MRTLDGLCTVPNPIVSPWYQKAEVHIPSIYLGHVPSGHPCFYMGAAEVLSPDKGLLLVYGDKLIKVDGAKSP